MRPATSIPATLPLATLVLPADVRARIATTVFLMIAGSILIALSARLSFWPAFSPVPVTGQTFAVLLVGAVLGARLGAATVALYLAEGAAGLPVFAGGGGVLYLFGHTGGYLAGFVLAAWITGSLAERGWDRRFGTTAMAMSLGTIAIFLCGSVWLGLAVGWPEVLALGVGPYIPGAVIKIAAAALLLPGVWRVVGQRRA